MRKPHIRRISFALALAVPSLAFAVGTPATAKTTKKHKTTHVAAPAGMDPARATQIQEALIKQGYLTGDPSGKWDAQSISAMQKLQSDNGWQTKVTPDARALIKLGLGPTSDQRTTTAQAVEAQQAQ